MFLIQHPLISSNANPRTSPSSRAAFVCPDWLVRISFRILTARPDKLHLQKTRSQTDSWPAGDSCGNTLSVLWMVGSRSLYFNTSLKNLQLINRKVTSELEGFWSSTEQKHLLNMFSIPALVLWCDGDNVHVCLSGTCSIKNIEIVLQLLAH